MVLKAFARILQAAMCVIASVAFPLIRVEQHVKMWMSVKEAIAVSMDARTLLAGIDVVAHKVISNIISGTNVWMRTNA